MNNKIQTTTDATTRFELVQRQAKALSKSTMIPPRFRDNLADTMVAMEIADRIGAPAFIVMQNLFEVYGQFAFSSKFLIASINSNGTFSPLRFEMTGKENSNEWGCRAIATDLRTEEKLIGPKVTIKMAHDEGWYGKKGSKWKTMPELMLHYRAAAFWSRLYAPEIASGMGGQTLEEINDVEGYAIPERGTPAEDLAAKITEAQETQTVEARVVPEPEEIAPEVDNSFIDEGEGPI